VPFKLDVVKKSKSLTFTL